MCHSSFSLLLLSYYNSDVDEDEDDVYTNLCLSACCSFYSSYTPHLSSPSPSPSFFITHIRHKLAIYHRQKDAERAFQAQADHEMQLDESIIKARNAALEAEEVQLLAERVKYRQSLIETVNKKNRPILVTTHGLSETTLKYASQLLELHKTYGYDIYSIGERACLLLCHSLLLFSIFP